MCLVIGDAVENEDIFVLCVRPLEMLLRMRNNLFYVLGHWRYWE